MAIVVVFMAIYGNTAVFKNTFATRWQTMSTRLYWNKKKSEEVSRHISKLFISCAQKKKKSSIVSISDKFLTVTVIIDLQPGKQN